MPTVTNDVIGWLLTWLWLPSVVGLIYLWSVYWRLRNDGDQWLIQMLCITAVPVTAVMVWVSYSTSRRLYGEAISTETATLAGALIVLGLCWVVPYKAMRIWITTHGGTAPEIAPAPANEVTNGVKKET